MFHCFYIERGSSLISSEGFNIILVLSNCILRFKNFNRSLHSCVNLTFISKMAALVEFHLEDIVLSEILRLCTQILKRQNITKRAPWVKGNIRFFWIVLLNFPFNNWAFFNFQIIWNKHIVSYYDLVYFNLLFNIYLSWSYSSSHGRCSSCYFFS